ncbi:MAG TPA: MBL fold metallo-hydrolase [Thermoleophilaceae bacterium]|nr:MBL fold metallo-hydrolase [Thermoleophilaceae bacterium]
MSRRRRRPELARADRILPGMWRLRLPLPWPGVPHVNAWAIAAGSGVVLVDTGASEPGAMAQLERALEQAGVRLDHVRLLVCTHAHPDHYGLAGPIVGAARCELWMHPNHGHMTRAAADPERLLERRIEIARHSGVPPAALERYEAERRDRGVGVAEVVLPDRELRDGTRVETDLGAFEVHETPGHAPSQVVLHQPERGLLISGDHVLGRISLYYDYGYTPDPAGEFLGSLDRVEPLGVQLVLAGHGRPRRDAAPLVAATRREALRRIDLVRAALDGRPRTPFDLVPVLLGDEVRAPRIVSWGLPEVLCYLRHLELRGEARRVAGEEPERWTA